MCENYGISNLVGRPYKTIATVPIHFVQDGFAGVVTPRDHRLYCGNVATCVDAANTKIERNKLDLDLETYLKIAGATNGAQGIHYVSFQGDVYSVIIRGKVTEQGESFGIVRTVYHHGKDKGGLVAKLESVIGQEDSLAQVNRKVRKLIKGGN